MNLTLLSLFTIIWVLLVTVLSFFSLNRYIAYKERVALAQLGFTPEADQANLPRRSGKRGVLWGGVITSMSGLALLLGLSTLGMGVWLLGGLVPLFIGVGMVTIYFMSGNTTEQPTPLPDQQSPAEPQEAIESNTASTNDQAQPG
ncbi:MAG: hypothetical protein LLG44_11950 [Chloroflexi bacterium]|nr:hypothetical protein [Chloroflexota bacterium]